MKHNSCPHCGAHIAFRRRTLPKSGGITCAQCGGVSYRVTGAFSVAAYLSVMYLMMGTQYWLRFPWWLSGVVIALVVGISIVFSPLEVSREFTIRQKIQRLFVAFGVIVVWTILLVWVMDHRPRVAAPDAVCPPASQSVP